MKKRVLFFCVLMAFLSFFSLSSKAEENDENIDFGADSLKYSLDDSTRKYMEEFGIDIENGKLSFDMNPLDFFGHIFTFFKSGIKRPLKALFLLLGIILALSAASAFNKPDSNMAPAVFAGTLCIAAVSIKDVLSAAAAANTAVKAITDFMLAFIPIFTSIVAVSGKTATSFASGALLLGAAQGVSAVCTFITIPLMSGYTALSVSSAVSPLTEKSALAKSVKNAALWIMSLASTVFLGILGIQSALSSAADTVGLKTTKFIVGTCVPVAGATLAEAASAVAASVSVIRSSVGAYAIAALVIIALPVLCEILMWRAVFLITGIISDLFSLSKTSSLLKAFDSVFSVISAVLLITLCMFVIALSIVIGAGKTV